MVKLWLFSDDILHIKNPKNVTKKLFSQFSSVQSLNLVRLFVTPWITARQPSLFITSSWSLLKLMSIKSVMPCNHLILCHPLLLLPPIPPSIRVFSNESTFRMRWPRYWIRIHQLIYKYTTNIWKPVAFLYINSRLEKEIRKTILFTIASLRIKYLKINLRKQKTCIKKTISTDERNWRWQEQMER